MIRHRPLLFSLAVIAYVCTLPASTKLRMDRSLETMFSETNPVRRDFERLQSTFGVSELVVVAYRDKNLWSQDGEGLERLQSIRRSIEALPGVDSAMDLSKLNQMLVQWQSATSLFGAGATSRSSYPILSTDDVLAVRMKQLFEGQTHSDRSDLVAIACILKRPERALVPISETLKSLRNLDVGVGQRALLAGQRVMIEDGFEEIETDGQRLGLVSALSLVVLLLVGFRSLRWALINIVLIHWSLTVSRGLMVAMSWQITMVSSMMASLVTVISVATLMHWMLGYQQLLQQGMSAEESLSGSLRKLRSPIAWACITDAIAFASLSLSQVGPVQDYGCMMALSSLVVLAGILLLVPVLALTPLLPGRWEQRLALSVEMGTNPSFGFVSVDQDRISRWLVSALRRCMGWSKTIVAIAILLSLVGLWGATRIDVETNFIRNFKQTSSLVEAYRAIENDMGRSHSRPQCSQER
jgi:uncharacterized protein